MKAAEAKPGPKALGEAAELKPSVSDHLGPLQVADVLAMLRLDESSLSYEDEPPGKLRAIRATTTVRDSKTKVVVRIEVVYTTDLMSATRKWDIKKVREATVRNVVFEK